MKYYINTVSRDHVMRGVEGGFTQANHGKPQALKRLRKSDWIIFYSPKTAFKDGETLQKFTAIGQVKDEDLYQFEMSPDFVPWRRNVDFKKCEEVLIRPMINELTFIKNKAQWGYMFRFGMFEIPEEDFAKIRKEMLD